jgi:DNA polymerase III subunit delta'
MSDCSRKTRADRTAGRNATTAVVHNFYGNQEVCDVLEQMIRGERIPGTMLFSGPAGIGKATLARRFAAMLLGDPQKIEKDDLSLPDKQAMLAEREKLPADKRNNDPLLVSTHPDFVTFPPDGPLRQISIHQMRLLKDRAQWKPLKGNWRVFLIDGIDRAFEQAANSLLKTLEEPPSHLVLIMTAQNPYDLLPTIRSRAVQFQLTPLSDDDMRAFAGSRGLSDLERRLALASGSPGVAVSIDLEAYDRRRSAMLKLLEVGAGTGPLRRMDEALGVHFRAKIRKVGILSGGTLSAAGRCADSSAERRTGAQCRPLRSPRHAGVGRVL